MNYHTTRGRGYNGNGAPLHGPAGRLPLEGEAPRPAPQALSRRDHRERVFPPRQLAGCRPNRPAPETGAPAQWGSPPSAGPGGPFDRLRALNTPSPRRRDASGFARRRREGTEPNVLPARATWKMRVVAHELADHRRRLPAWNLALRAGVRTHGRLRGGAGLGRPFHTHTRERPGTGAGSRAAGDRPGQRGVDRATDFAFTGTRVWKRTVKIHASGAFSPWTEVRGTAL
jgi:hypothetical protein